MSRILIVAPNWLGDAIMALPVVAAVRQHFSGDQVIVGARLPVAPLFRAVAGIDGIQVLARDAAGGGLAADIGILLPNSFRSVWMLKRAGIRERWGYRSDFRRLLLTRSVRRPRGKVSFPEYYAYLARQLGFTVGPLVASLALPQAIRERGLSLLREEGWTPGTPLVGIAPGAAFGHAKRWRSDRFAGLAARVTAERKAACVFLGRSEDRDAAREPRGIDLIGRTDLPALMGVLSHCDVVVANDSGALHLAAALGVPAVGIYGPTDERLSRPLPAAEDAADRVVTLSEPVFCRPCFLADCPIDHRCMKRITTDRVYAAVGRFLQERDA